MKKSSNARYWLTLVCCCGLIGGSIGVLTNSIGVFYVPVSASLGVGRGAIATHATLAMLATATLSPMAAKMLEKLPLRVYLGIGALLGSGSALLMAFSTNIWAFYILGVVKGIGVTFFGVIAVTTIISNWFFKNYGLAVGITLSFSGLCGAIFSPVFSAIIEAAGWKFAFICMAVLTLAFSLPGVLVLRLTPQEVFLPPLGGPMEGFSMPAQTRSGKVRLYLPAVLLTCTFAALSCGVTSVGQHFPTVAEAAGYSAQIGAMMVSAGMVGNIVSKLLIGVLSDHKGPFFANGAMLAVNAVAMFVLFILPAGAPVLAVGIAFVFGAVYGVGGAGIPLLTRGVFGPEKYSTACSIVQSFANIGAALFMTLIGVVYDMTGSCDPVLIGSIAIQAANIAMLVALARMRKRAAH